MKGGIKCGGDEYELLLGDSREGLDHGEAEGLRGQGRLANPIPSSVFHLVRIATSCRKSLTVLTLLGVGSSRLENVCRKEIHGGFLSNNIGHMAEVEVRAGTITTSSA